MPFTHDAHQHRISRGGWFGLGWVCAGLMALSPAASASSAGPFDIFSDDDEEWEMSGLRKWVGAGANIGFLRQTERIDYGGLNTGSPERDLGYAHDFVNLYLETPGLDFRYRSSIQRQTVQGETATSQRFSMDTYGLMRSNWVQQKPTGGMAEYYEDTSWTPRYLLSMARYDTLQVATDDYSLDETTFVWMVFMVKSSEERISLPAAASGSAEGADDSPFTGSVDDTDDTTAGSLNISAQKVGLSFGEGITNFADWVSYGMRLKRKGFKIGGVDKLRWGINPFYTNPLAFELYYLNQSVNGNSSEGWGASWSPTLRVDNWLYTPVLDIETSLQLTYFTGSERLESTAQNKRSGTYFNFRAGGRF